MNEPSEGRAASAARFDPPHVIQRPEIAPMSRVPAPLLLALALASCQAPVRPPAQREWNVRVESPSIARPEGEEEFIRLASQAATFEIEAARLALEKDTSGAVRAFATITIEGRKETKLDLEALAKRREIPLPENLGAEDRQALDELRRLDGHEFDCAYVRCEMTAQDETIALFERVSRDATDPGIRKFALRTLSDLRKHRVILGEVQGPAVRVAHGTPGN